VNYAKGLFGMLVIRSNDKKRWNYYLDNRIC